MQCGWYNKLKTVKEYNIVISNDMFGVCKDMEDI